VNLRVGAAEPNGRAPVGFDVFPRQGNNERSAAQADNAGGTAG